MAKALAVHLHMVPRCEMSQHHSAFSAFSAHHFFLGFIHFLKPKLVSFKWAIMKHMAAILSSDVFFLGNPGGGCLAMPCQQMAWKKRQEQLYHPNYFRTLVCRDLQRRRWVTAPFHGHDII